MDNDEAQMVLSGRLLALIGVLWMFASDNTALIRTALGLKPAAAPAATKEKPMCSQAIVPTGADRECYKYWTVISPTQYLHYYRCPRCANEWTDKWCATCNDDCPKCGMRHIEPYKSEEA